jgi:ABC-type Fe3+-hydroxamate transport system substrate-binding protein
MRIGMTIAAAVAALTLGACGGDGNDTGASATLPSLTAPTGATHTGTATTGRKTSGQTTTQATISTPGKQGKVVTLPNGEPAIVSPGTRAACIKKWAPQFPPGEARQAILAQCRKIPR